MYNYILDLDEFKNIWIWSRDCMVWRTLIVATSQWRKLTWTLTSPSPQPSDVASDVHVTQVNMNLNIPIPPTQWRNVRVSEHEH